MAPRLVEVFRSGIVESIHTGHIAVVLSNGKILHEVGDSSRVVFFRSSAKPIITIACLETGIAREYYLTTKEIAVMASSHSGTGEHISVIKGIMNKINITEDVLDCGIQEPTGDDAAKELIVSGKCPTKLHTNCSGKHVGVIAAAKLKRYDTEGYFKPEHPIQSDILKVISDFTSLEPGSILKGVDGCGIPVFAIPLKNMALAYARLCEFEWLDGMYGRSQKMVVNAMKEYPDMVAGHGRVDTELMKLFGDRVIGKSGAEGVFCAVLPAAGIGIAIKIEDGSNRAVAPVILETLVQMDVINKDEMGQLKRLWHPPVLNRKDEMVGEIRPCFQLAR